MIKALLVDDNALIRNAIKTMLNSEPEIQVIGECTDGSEVISFLEHQKPDVILMDYQMPTLNGAETTKLVKDLFPELKIIGLSSTVDYKTKETFFESGICGFISKYEATQERIVHELSNCHSMR